MGMLPFAPPLSNAFRSEASKANYPVFPKWSSFSVMVPFGSPPDKALGPNAAFACHSDRAIAAVGASFRCCEAPDARGWRAVDTLAEPCSFVFHRKRCQHVAAGGARRRWIAARTARTIGPDTATSAS